MAALAVLTSSPSLFSTSSLSTVTIPDDIAITGYKPDDCVVSGFTGTSGGVE